MYCSSCGVAVTQGLPYCNYCGAKLTTGDSGDKSPDIRPGGDAQMRGLLVIMMVATFVFGLFVITIFMGMMKSILHFEYGPLIAFTTLSFLIMLMLESIFIRLLFRPSSIAIVSRAKLSRMIVLQRKSLKRNHVSRWNLSVASPNTPPARLIQSIASENKVTAKLFVHMVKRRILVTHFITSLLR